MKLCFLASANSVHSCKWVKFFTERGHQVHWISLTPNTQGEIENARFYQISALFPFSFFRLQKLVREIKPDILHAHYAGVNGFLAALTGFHPFILTAWGSDVLFAGKHWLKSYFVRYALKKADLITCDAEHLKKTIVEMGVEEGKIEIIYFGIDTKKFNNANTANKYANNANLRIISLRSLEPVYNIETLIKAASLVLKEIPEAKFIIAGKGSEEEKLQKLADELGASKNVQFVGFVPQDNLPELLRFSDIYISTALSDAGIAGSTAEAMACGLPVVITNTGENEKWVKDGQGGYLIPVKNSEVLAEKIVYLLENPQTREKFGKINRKTIEERNDYDKEMVKVEKIYLSFATAKEAV